MTRILLAPSLTIRTNGSAEHSLMPGSIENIFEQLFTRYPTLRDYILDENSNPREFIAIFRNDVLVNKQYKLSEEIGDDETLIVLQSVPGG